MKEQIERRSKEEWQDRVTLIQAWIDGSDIEVYSEYLLEWADCPHPVFLWTSQYRVKPVVDKYMEALDLLINDLRAIRDSADDVTADNLFETLGKTCRPS